MGFRVSFKKTQDLQEAMRQLGQKAQQLEQKRDSIDIAKAMKELGKPNNAGRLPDATPQEDCDPGFDVAGQDIGGQFDGKDIKPIPLPNGELINIENINSQKINESIARFMSGDE